tara:strand:- start:551 stop:1219 length:669 start_codon:yes stop_codon:yes gene_type:complete
MSNAVLVMGKTGSGKSTSMEKLDPKETFIINVVGKDLPFRGGSKRFTPEKKNYHATHSPATIVALMKQISKDVPHIKTIIIDDFQYTMSYEFMTTKTTGFDKFNEIAEHAFEIINTAKNLRDDLTVVFLAHTDEIVDSLGQKSYKIKTIGKLLDDKITLEGLFTVVLMAEQRLEGMDTVYGFVTKGTVRDTVKTPKDMFEDEYIPNDLKLVIDSIEEYNNAE